MYNTFSYHLLRQNKEKKRSTQDRQYEWICPQRPCKRETETGASEGRREGYKDKDTNTSFRDYLEKVGVKKREEPEPPEAKDYLTSIIRSTEYLAGVFARAGVLHNPFLICLRKRRKAAHQTTAQTWT